MKNELKIVALGDSGVGKTSIVKRFTASYFNSNQQPTVGAAYLQKQQVYKGITYTLNIWDTAGQQKYNLLTKMYYRSSDAALLVYDIQNYSSFQALKKWSSQVMENCPGEVFIIVVGNKADLVEQVSEEQEQNFALQIGASHIRVSALEDTGIADIFYQIVQACFQKGIISRPQSIRLSKEVKVKRGCC